MKKRKLINKFYTGLFVAASLAAFILFCLIYFYMSLPRAGADRFYRNDNSRYYLNEDYEQADPYITKQPDLSDMLLGPIISDADPGLGSPSAPIAIVIFSDYLCGFCREQEAVIMEILEAYGDKARVIYKDYPESDYNSLSWQAAAAARCASEQGAFREYHDGLYEQADFNQDFILTLAKKLDLNVIGFNECLASERVKNSINDNIEEANALDINGIPFIYVNDQEVMGQASYQEMERLVEIELKKQKSHK